MKVGGNGVSFAGKKALHMVLLAVAISLTLLMIGMGSGTAWADGIAAPISSLNHSKAHNVVAYPGSHGDELQEEVYHANGSNKITAAKSSNPSVVSVKIYKKGTVLEIAWKKAGSAKVSYKYGGKKHVVKYAVRNYVSPLKSFKLGGKEYYSKLKHSGNYSTGKFLKGKVKVKAAKGWKLTKIYQFVDTGTYMRTEVKNGGKLASEVEELRVCFKNKKTGEVASASLEC